MAYVGQFRDKWRAQIQVNGERRSRLFTTEQDALNWANAEKAKMKLALTIKTPIERKLALGTDLVTAVPARVIRALQEVPYLPEEIVDATIPLPLSSGVYFLLRGKEVVYVGQSIDMLGRISKHRRTRIQFDGFALFPCEPERMDKLESMYITALVPEYNISLGNIKIDGVD
ncbi:MAG: GIY-YIG nuclease family protein [Patescibacteria group bacterium]|nr:GIY-YIG nuclease family protein [Patescibacteria group bacterium]